MNAVFLLALKPTGGLNRAPSTRESTKKFRQKLISDFLSGAPSFVGNLLKRFTYSGHYFLNSQ